MVLLESELARSEGSFLAVVFIVSLCLVSGSLNAFVRVRYFKCVWPFEVRIKILASVHFSQVLGAVLPILFMFECCKRVADACSAKVRCSGKVGVCERVAAADG